MWKRRSGEKVAPEAVRVTATNVFVSVDLDHVYLSDTESSMLLKHVSRKLFRPNRLR
jgi:hypothetical protein